MCDCRKVCLWGVVVGLVVIGDVCVFVYKGCKGACVCVCVHLCCLLECVHTYLGVVVGDCMYMCVGIIAMCVETFGVRVVCTWLSCATLTTHTSPRGSTQEEFNTLYGDGWQESQCLQSLGEPG